MGKRMKSELWDNMQRFMAMYNDHMVHYYNKTDGEFDIDVLKLAIGKAVDLAPILKSKFVVRFTKPVWEEIDGFTVDDIFEFEEGDDSWENVEKFLVQVIDEEAGPQVRFKLFRKDGKDTFCMVINHMTFDGQAIKEWLGILAKYYTKLLKDRDFVITDYVNGDRSFGQLFKHFTFAEKLKANTRFAHGKMPDEMIGFPYSKKNRYALEPHIMRHKLSAEDFEKIKEVGKRNHMTLNDIILAVYSRSLADLIPLDQVPLDVDCILDLRRYLPDGHTEGLTNFVTKIICPVDNYKNESIFSTIAQVNQNMAAAKGDYPGLGGLPQLRFGYWILPHPIAKKVVAAAFNNPLVAISNIGIMDAKTLKFGDLTTEDTFITGSIKKAPYIQLALTTYHSEITFTVALYANEEDLVTVKKFFDNMDKYFSIIKNS